MKELWELRALKKSDDGNEVESSEFAGSFTSRLVVTRGWDIVD